MEYQDVLILSFARRCNYAMANKTKPTNQPAAACSIRWRYLYRNNSRRVERSQTRIRNRFSHLSEPDNSQTVCRSSKTCSFSRILYRYSLGAIMLNKIKWKFKLFFQWLKPKSRYVHYEDFSDCYTASFIAQLHRRTKLK